MQPTTRVVMHVDVVHHCEDFQKESVKMDTSLLAGSYKSPILKPQLLPCDDDNSSVSHLSNFIMKPCLSLIVNKKLTSNLKMKAQLATKVYQMMTSKLFISQSIGMSCLMNYNVSYQKNTLI